MKKIFYLLVLLAMFGVQNHARAQWVAQNSGTNNELDGVFFTDPNTGYVVGMDTASFRGLVLKTTNGGSTWIPLSVSCMFPQSPYFTDANTGYVATYDTLLKTTNAGATWSRYPINMGLGIFGLHFYNATIGYAAGINFSSTTTAILKTTNAGSTWTPQTIPSPLHYHPNSLFCTNANTCYYAGGDARKTTDGGLTWNNMTTQSNADWSGVYFTSSTNGILVGGGASSGSIDRTTDAGTSWTTVNSGSEFVTAVYFSDTNTGYAVGTGGVILKTTDGGSTWTSQTSPSARRLNSVHFPVANTGYAVGDGGTIIKYTSPSDVPDPTLMPTSFGLSQNYPNPFNPSTRIGYDLPRSTFVTLKVYDLLGREIATLAEGFRSAGRYTVEWEVHNLSGGVYFFRLSTGNFVETKRMILLR